MPQILAHGAFGTLLASTGTPQGPFGFAATSGYQEDADTGLKLLGHRYYDPSTGRFLTRDPAKDGRNWYVYCDGNPLRGVDPTGLIIVPPDGETERRQYEDATDYLRRDPGYRKMIEDLEKSDTKYYIDIVHNDDDHFDPRDHHVWWDPESALETTNGGRQSPALGLGHELDHAWGHDHHIPITSTGPPYDTSDEKRVIEGREGKFGKHWGEGIRHDHGGKPYRVGGPRQRY